MSETASSDITAKDLHWSRAGWAQVADADRGGWLIELEDGLAYFYPPSPLSPLMPALALEERLEIGEHHQFSRVGGMVCIWSQQGDLLGRFGSIREAALAVVALNGAELAAADALAGAAREV